MSFRRVFILGISPILSFPLVSRNNDRRCAENCDFEKHKPILMLADLDGTLVGCGEGFSAWLEHWIEEEVSKESILAYNTARCITDYHHLVKNNAKNGLHLPVPDVLITGEGTEIRWCVDKNKGLFKLDQIWERRMKEHWRQSGLEAKVKDLILPYDECLWEGLNRPQNSPPHGEYRLAITVRGKEKALELTEYFKHMLGPNVALYTMEGWEDFELIVAMPHLALKKNAALYVQDALGFSHECCIAAGDTRGDSTMLETGFPFICVGNSSSQLLEDARALSLPHLHYVAKGTHGKGVVEGVQFFRQLLNKDKVLPAATVEVLKIPPQTALMK